MQSPFGGAPMSAPVPTQNTTIGQAPAPAQTPTAPPPQPAPSPAPGYAPPAAPVSAAPGLAGVAVLNEILSTYKGVTNGMDNDLLLGGPNGEAAYYLLQVEGLEGGMGKNPQKPRYNWILRSRVLRCVNSRSHVVGGTASIIKNLLNEYGQGEAGAILAALAGLHPVREKARADALVTREYIVTSFSNPGALVGKCFVVKSVDGVNSKKGTDFTNHLPRPLTQEHQQALNAAWEDEAKVAQILRQIADA